MPLFDLKCNDCNKEFVKIVPYNQLQTLTCPQCQSKNYERIFKTNVTGPIHSTNQIRKSPPSSGFS